MSRNPELPGVQSRNPFREGALAMPSGGSVSRLLDGLGVGDESAVQQLWQRYFHRLVALARQKLQSAPRRVGDEEDVALSAFASFCRAAEAGRFPQLPNVPFSPPRRREPG